MLQSLLTEQVVHVSLPEQTGNVGLAHSEFCLQLTHVPDAQYGVEEKREQSEFWVQATQTPEEHLLAVMLVHSSLNKQSAQEFVTWLQ